MFILDLVQRLAVYLPHFFVWMPINICHTSACLGVLVKFATLANAADFNFTGVETGVVLGNWIEGMLLIIRFLRPQLLAIVALTILDTWLFVFNEDLKHQGPVSISDKMSNRKSRSREIGSLNHRVVLKFDRNFESSATEVPS